MEYTWNNVIIDPTSDKAKNAIGKIVYYSNNPQVCLESANDNDCFCGVLQSVEPTERLPFVVNGRHYECIIVKTIPIYEQNQAKWITDNGIKEGDCVRILRKAGKDEEGWGDAWMPDMDNYVGRVYKITEICPDGIELGSEYIFPYFVLEKVEPKPRYVSFESPQEFISAYYKASKEVMQDTESMLLNFGMWLKWQDHYVGITYISKKGVNYGAEFLDWDELLDEYTFLDGSPVGKEANGEATLHEKKMQDELPIGARFLYGGQLVEVVDEDQCGDCVFAETDCSQKRCVPERRSDKKSVCFKEVKGERLQAED